MAGNGRGGGMGVVVKEELALTKFESSSSSASDSGTSHREQQMTRSKRGEIISEISESLGNSRRQNKRR